MGVYEWSIEDFENAVKVLAKKRHRKRLCLRYCGSEKEAVDCALVLTRNWKRFTSIAKLEDGRYVVIEHD